ncbi:Ig-like domain-containing protein [Marinivivus vitaminiproducens]|uniref:Ig-like domain-containing protein n=1 Tax=Marinivivus vitaminiproducens TaxID=3035935 RepID=UPI0027A9A9C7|nr:Ig-like domain-containing protein [Geminicoccaceae bacterium SCSIO 64248]
MAAPVAQDDTITTKGEHIRLFNVVTGLFGPDTDADGDRLTVSRVAGQSSLVGASVQLDSGARFQLRQDGVLVFNPNDAYDDLPSGEVATESVTYTVRDSAGQTSTATVAITIGEPSADVTTSAGVYVQVSRGGPAFAERETWHASTNGELARVTDDASGASPRLSSNDGSARTGETVFFTEERGAFNDPNQGGNAAVWRVLADGDAARIDGITSPSVMQVGERAVIAGGIDGTYQIAFGNPDGSVDPLVLPDGVQAGAPLSVGSFGYFRDNTPDGVHLFRFDDQGTVEDVQDLLPDGISAYRFLGSWNEVLYFEGYRAADNTGRATFRLNADDSVDRIAAGWSDVDDFIVPFGDRIYKYVESAHTGFGTLTPVPPPDVPYNYGSNQAGFRTDADSLYASTNATFEFEGDQPYDRELLQIHLDGSSTIHDLVPGSGSSSPILAKTVGEDGLLFSATTPQTGRELFRLTQAGDVELVADIVPGPAGSGIQQVAEVGDDIYFTSDQGIGVGRELWRLDALGETTRVSDLGRADVGGIMIAVDPAGDDAGSLLV